MNQRILKVLAVLISALSVVILLMIGAGAAREDSRQARLKLKKPDIVN
ncbi:hypothetical protein JNL27_15810, partial [bacterium]|nr:hypothetical protein [bacterium]